MPRALLNAVDLLLALFGAWCLLVPLILGRELELALPFGQHLTSGLTPNNLVWFWIAFYLRLHVRGSGEKATWLARRVGSASPFLLGLVLFLALSAVYLGAGRTRMWPSGDTIPMKLLPVTLLEEGNLDLDEFRAGVPYERQYGFWKVGDHYFSAYPIAPALTALPVYGLVALTQPTAFRAWREAYDIPGGDDLPNIINFMEQLSSAIVAALSVVVFWSICLQVSGDRRLATWLALALGLGTSVMSTAALALWQHGPACLSLGLLVFCLLRAEQKSERTFLFLAGLAGGWGYACRPTVIVMLGFTGLWVLYRFRHRALYFLVPCAVMGLAVLVYNYVAFGKLSGGYARNLTIFSGFNAHAVLALLFSPSRGLFFFSPFLLFALPGVWRSCRRPWGVQSVCAYGALGTFILFSFWSTWSAGSSFGSRYLCEMAYLLVLVMAFHGPFLVRKRWVFELLLLAVLFSCHLHMVGAQHGDAGWTAEVFKPEDVPAAWRWSESQAAYTLFRGP